MIITPTSLTITQLLGSTNEQYIIPAYQRRYSWKDKQLWELLDDISLIDGADTHLLGSIVCLTGHHVAGINKLELVDGQQRLTTISILLQCIHDRLSRVGEATEAQDIARLLSAKALGGNPVRKISLDSIDSHEFEKLLANDSVVSPVNSHLKHAFDTFRDWVEKQSLPDLGTFLYRLKNHAIIIRLDVSDAKDAFKLFETINNRGLRLSPPDIIKNFLLGNAARFDSGALELARSKWAELITHLDGINFENFFRHFLCAKFRRRITTSFVIANFKRTFMQNVSEALTLPERHHYLDADDSMDDPDDDPDAVDSDAVPADDVVPDKSGERVTFAEFMGDLVESAKMYGQIVRGTTGNINIDKRLRNLQMIKSVQSYGFLMYLKVGGCNDQDFQTILQLTEAFMLRRHTCRMRSNENESAFAKLCSVDCKKPLPEVIETFRQYSPSDERFRDEFSSGVFSGPLIDRARYCLEQFEMKKHGNFSEIKIEGPENVHVEHIIPQKITTRNAKQQFGDWTTYLGTNADAKHSKYVGRIGNLTLFAGPLNIGASNNPYERKKGRLSAVCHQNHKHPPRAI